MWAQLVDGSQVSVTHCDAVHVDAYGAKFEVKLKNGRLEVPFSPAVTSFPSLRPPFLTQLSYTSSIRPRTLLASVLIH